MYLSTSITLRDEMGHDESSTTIYETCYAVIQTLPETTKTSHEEIHCFSFRCLSYCSRVHAIIILST
jgi:hypothetical protein